MTQLISNIQEAIRITPQGSPSRWRTILRTNFTNIEELAVFLQLTPSQVQELDRSSAFTLNLPRRLAEKMAKSTLYDPLFLQFVPLKKEKEILPGFTQDPVQDKNFRKEAKLLQKYHGRSLIITTSACAMHCRYCFRKNFPYEIQEAGFKKELDILKNDLSIEEVLLSGGDPLSLSDSSLEALLNDINSIAHVKRIRFHTRFPMGIPERIDSSFLKVLNSSKKQLWFVIHTNHPREFDQDIWNSLKEVQKLGIPVLCQSVLLRGINDNLKTLQELYSALTDHGILPYYLYGLDRVQGTHHFEVSQERGKALIQELMQCLPGYAVPKYVQEIPGEASKTPIQ
jgi:EF-P beta-lysylation protein EpmB